ncbi:MAG: type II secretion system protein [Rickettsiales bacterium]
MRRSAFSLVELSIVLVILGLLTGGILSGQSLIRAAELRAVATEYSRYATAVQSFRDKYFAIPGDMNNATQFWGRLNGNADCVTNSSAAVDTSKGVCDGNGSGGLASAAAASQSGEYMQFWRHLAAAGLIEGSYTGIAGTGGGEHCVIGTTCPKSKLSNAGWGVAYYPNFAGNSDTYALDYGNFFYVGAPNTIFGPNLPVLKPEEAWNIDTKFDDGKPAQGAVIALFWNNQCAAADDGSSANNDLVASYRLNDSTIQCSLYFRRAF